MTFLVNNVKLSIMDVSRYHDMPDVIDFLVLQQFYNEAKERNWQPGVFVFFYFLIIAFIMWFLFKFK